MPWYVLAVIYVFSIAFLSLSLRWALRDGKYKPDLYSVINTLYAGVFFALGGLLLGQDLDFSKLPVFNVILGSALTIGVFIFVAKALSRIEVGTYNLINNTRGVMVIPLAIIFLDESVSLALLIGALLILSGALIVSYVPGQKIRWGIGELYAFLAAACVAAAITNETVVFSDESIDPALLLSVEHLIAGVGLLLIQSKHLPEMASYLKQPDFHLRTILPVVFLSVGLFSFFAAFQSDVNASLLTAIGQLSSVVAVVLGIFLLGERTRIAYKLIAVAISFVGLVFLSL